MYDFSKGVERKGTNCVKWDVPFITERVTPMWIADMDFEVAPAITKNLKKKAEQGAFGYQFLSQEYYDAVINWMKRRHDYDVSSEEIVHIPNVVLGLKFAVQIISEPGDEFIIMTPVYGPFFRVVTESNRVLVESPMKNVNGYYTMDLEDLESRITEKTKAVIICNPHNPTGRVWEQGELQALADICVKHNLYILSDDIHSELLTKKHKHTFISSLSDEIRDRTFVFTSPGKAFNLASIHVANCFISNKEIRGKFQKLADQSFAAECNAFAEPSLVGAYNESEEWLNELNEYIEGNLDYFVDYIQKEIPKLKIYKPEGTYLVWVDFRKTGILHSHLQMFLKDECGVYVNEGDFFGTEGKGFARFNVACPRENITPVLEKLKEAFGKETFVMKKKGLCGICPDKCPVEVTIEEGKIIKVEGDKDHPGGRVCPRGALAPQIIYSEKRITKPLIRDGEKGSGKFREATWEEALDVAAKGFLKVKDEYGPDALVSYVGSSGREDAVMRCFSGPKAFFRNMGSHNDMHCGSTCNFSSNLMTPVLTYGVPTPKLYQDIPNSEVVFVWGKNSKTDSGPLTTLMQVKDAKKRGAKIIVIDPRGEGMAELADIWIPIIPGADGALVMAMLKIIVEEERYDKEFVAEYTKGFEEFAEYLKSLTVKEMEKYCGVSEEMIRSLVDIFCSTTKISLVSYTGLEYQLSGIQNNRAIQTMWAITGKIDVPGGICIAVPDNPTVPLIPMENVEQAVGAVEFPLFSRLSGCGQFSKIPKAILEGRPYPVRGMLICAASPSITYPDQDLWEEAYMKLDCLVVLERFMSNDCKFADVILPATTYFEDQHVVNVPGGVRLRNRMIDPVGEAKDDVFIFHELGKRMEFGDVFPGNDEDLMLWMCNGNEQLLRGLKFNEYGIVKKPELKYEKYKTGELRADGQPGFPTPSGKFEISSTYIAECGYTSYPEYKDIRTITEMGSEEEYPLIMTTAARSGLRFCSFGPNLKEIADREPLPTIDMNAEDAEKYGLSDGEAAVVETVFGKGDFNVRICPMAKGSIHIAGGAGSFYMEGEWKSHNVNKICSMNYADPLCGFLTFKSVPCKVIKK